MANDIPPPFPPPVAKKKGLHPLAWAGIGCGGITIIAVVLIAIGAVKFGKSVIDSVKKSIAEHPAKEAAEMVFRDYPTLEKTAENPETGTFTLRVKSSGEEIATTYDDWVHGKVAIKDAAGAAAPALQGDASKIPAWVPRYPGATGELSLLHQESPSRIHGILVADTTDSKEAIDTFFETESGKLFGLTSSGKTTTEINGKRALRMSYSGGKRELKIYAYGTPGSPMTVVTVYSEEK